MRALRDTGVEQDDRRRVRVGWLDYGGGAPDADLWGREVITQADRSGHNVVGRLMLDRISATGRLTGWMPEGGLDHAYPLGGHLTHRLLHGDPRKIVLARHDVTVSSGNHRAPGHKPDPDRICAVHHFKWRSGVLDDLRRRVVT